MGYLKKGLKQLKLLIKTWVILFLFNSFQIQISNSLRKSLFDWLRTFSLLACFTVAPCSTSLVFWLGNLDVLLYGSLQLRTLSPWKSLYAGVVCDTSYIPSIKNLNTKSQIKAPIHQHCRYEKITENDEERLVVSEMRTIV